MSLQIRIPVPDTELNRTIASEVSGRQTKVAGSWVDDLVETGKTVMLCQLCKHKFNPKKRHYIKWSIQWLAIAKCDGCNNMDRNVQVYIPEADYPKLSPDYGRKRGRWA